MTAAIAPASIGEGRIHYMDNLRALAMLAGVLFHAGLAHSVLVHGYWPTADEGRSILVDAVAWFSHLFRMPLFFVVAGFFAALLTQKRGIGAMLGNRFARVFLPFVLFWPILYLTMGWLITYAADHVENLSPLLAMVKKWLADSNRPTAPPTLMHLWFLPYLMCFCILVWVANTLEVKWPHRWFESVRVGVFVGLAPIALVPALIGVPAPLPAPESFFPQWWALVFYGLYFFFGYRLFHNSTLIERIRPLAPRLLVASLVGYVLFFLLLRMQNHAHPASSVHVLQALLQAGVGFWMTLTCLIFGKRWLDRGNRFLRYLAEASYWAYIVHLPILFVIQYSMMDVRAHWSLKFIFACAATLGIAFASYQLLVRNTVLGQFLNGSRPTRRPGQASITSVRRIFSSHSE
jgi:glucan biosynthesis protein C